MISDPKAAKKALMLARHARADGGAVPGRKLNPQGLYSHAAELASGLNQEKGTGQQMLASLKSAKPDELKYSGASQLAAKPTVTKSDLVNHFNSALPDIRETKLSPPDPRSAHGEDDEDDEDERGAQYANYTLPGDKQNYRELLLHLPEYKHVKPNTPGFAVFNPLRPGQYGFYEDQDEARKVSRAMREQYQSPENYSKLEEHQRGMVDRHDYEPKPWVDTTNRKVPYVDTGNHYSDHWEDTPNVLAHLRMADRQDTGGNKVLHLEELQSDWGQDARKKGVIDPEAMAENSRLRNVLRRAHSEWADYARSLAGKVSQDNLMSDPKYAELADKRKAAMDAVTNHEMYTPGLKGVGDAPYIGKTQAWTDLGLKRALREAAAGKYDKMVWTPGQAQADRYGLEKHIDELHHWRDGDYIGISAFKNNRPVINKEYAAPDKLDSLVGSEMARKILNNEGRDHPTSGTKYFSGLDLKAGGEGMRGYYDNILPKRLLALAREHDPEAQLGTHDIALTRKDEGHAPTMRERMELPGLTITPKMRESILKRGFKAYRRGGTVQKRSGGETDDSLTHINDAADMTMPGESGRLSSAVRQAKKPGGETSPLFDLSSLHETPRVDQFDLPRYVPPRGVPDRVAGLLKNKDVIGKMLEVIQSGNRMGGSRWYNAEPLRHEFVNRLGKDTGHHAFRKYMDFVAAASPRSEVGTNARNASFYYHRHMSGQGVPEVGDKNPQPYGHMAQRNHQMNAKSVAGGGLDPLNNPKPASFAENLVGNQSPVTVDTHAFRLPAMLARDPRYLKTDFQSSKDAPKQNIQKDVESGRLPIDDAISRAAYWQEQPKDNEYGAMEALYKHLARESNLTPAQTQASAWVGGGHLTGLASDESKPFMSFLEDRIHKTAAHHNMEPRDVLDKFVRGQLPLRASGGQVSIVDKALRITKNAKS
jgi:hypothetical protein